MAVWSDAAMSRPTSKTSVAFLDVVAFPTVVVVVFVVVIIMLLLLLLCY